MPSPLQIVPNDPSFQGKEGSLLKQRRIERTAYFEKVWRDDPQRFDHSKTSMGRDKQKRVQGLIETCSPKEGQKACDLGCGAGANAIWLANKHLDVDAVDIASLAVERLRALNIPNLHPTQDYVPFTKLPDDSYDLVLCTDLIGYLHRNEYRLLFSELARVVKPRGFVFCSTAIDLRSYDALERFLQLAESELEIFNNSFAYDRLYIYLLDLLALPRRLARASESPDYRKEAIEKRRGFGRWFFQTLSHPIFRYLWKGCEFVANPVYRLADGSDRLRRFLQSITQFFWQENGITHIIIQAKRRSILNTDPKEVPEDVQYPKAKKTVWE